MFSYINISFSDSFAFTNQYCYPDCDSNLWTPVPPAPSLAFYTVLPCGEPVYIFYRVRLACNEYWDIFIERMLFLNGIVGGEFCGETMTMAQMLGYVTEQLLIQNPMQFPPPNNHADTCINSYRVLLSSCWSSNFHITAGNAASKSGTSSSSSSSMDIQDGILEPCRTLNCCMQAYTVCIRSGQRVITYKPELSVPGKCDPNALPSCKSVCE